MLNTYYFKLDVRLEGAENLISLNVMHAFKNDESQIAVRTTSHLNL